MKTDIHTFKAPELMALVACLAPSVYLQVIWEHDNDIHPDIRKDCDMPDDTSPDDWQAWRSEVRATAIINGKAAGFLKGECDFQSYCDAK